MSTKVSLWVWQKVAPHLGEKEGPLLLTLLTLADISRDHGKVWASHGYIATKAHQGARTVRGNIEVLEARGLLRTEPTPGRPDVIWLNLTATTLFPDGPGTDEPGALEKGPRRPRHEMPMSGSAPDADGVGATLPPTPAGGADKPVKGTKEDNLEAIASKPRLWPKSRFCPADWSPTASHSEKAEELGISPEQVRVEEQKFREFEFKDPRTDWDRAFHRWLRTAAERMKENGHGRGRQLAHPDRSAERGSARIEAMVEGVRIASTSGRRRWGL